MKRIILFVYAIFAEQLTGIYSNLIGINRIIETNLSITEKMYREKFFDHYDDKDKILKIIQNSTQQQELIDLIAINQANREKDDPRDFDQDKRRLLYPLFTTDQNNQFIRKIILDNNYNLIIFLHDEESYAELAEATGKTPSISKTLLGTIFIFVSVVNDEDNQISSFEVLTNFDELNKEFSGAKYIPWIKSQIVDYSPKQSFLNGAIFIPTEEMIEIFNEIEHVFTTNNDTFRTLNQTNKYDRNFDF